VRAAARAWLVGALVLGAAAFGAEQQDDPAKAAARDRIMEAYKEYSARMEAGEKAEALGPAKRAYDYAQQDLDIADEELAITAYALGDLLLELGRPIDALRPLAHALQCDEQQLGALAPRTLRTQRRIARANRELERWKTAELTYLDLVSRYEQLESDQTASLAGLHSRLAKLMIEAGEPARARRYGLRAMTLYKQAKGPKSVEVGLLSIQLAHISFDLGDFDEGFDFLEYGTPIVEEHLQPGDPQLISIYEFLVEVYGKTGDTRRQRRYRGRLKKSREAQAEAAAPDASG
jgi:tetratricopeptide (TPR) repeat protein